MGIGPTLLKELHRIRNKKKQLEFEQKDQNKSSDNIITTTAAATTHMKFWIILDCSCIPFIDSVGSGTLSAINRVVTEKEYLFFLAGASRSVREDLVRAHGKQWKNILDCIFPSIQDALSARNPCIAPITALNKDVGHINATQ